AIENIDLVQLNAINVIRRRFIKDARVIHCVSRSKLVLFGDVAAIRTPLRSITDGPRWQSRDDPNTRALQDAKADAKDKSSARQFTNQGELASTLALHGAMKATKTTECRVSDKRRS